MDKKYWPHITSYDYDAPISEAGSTGQPGIGGPSKFEVRHVARVHSALSLPKAKHCLVYQGTLRVHSIGHQLKLGLCACRVQSKVETAAQIIRDVIQKHTGVEAPAPEAPPRIAAMGSVKLSQFASLLDSAKALAGSAAADVQYPDIMEEYGQRQAPTVFATPCMAPALHHPSLLHGREHIECMVRTQVFPQMEGPPASDNK